MHTNGTRGLQVNHRPSHPLPQSCKTVTSSQASLNIVNLKHFPFFFTLSKVPLLGEVQIIKIMKGMLYKVALDAKTNTAISCLWFYNIIISPLFVACWNAIQIRRASVMVLAKIKFYEIHIRLKCQSSISVTCTQTRVGFLFLKTSTMHSQ